MQILIAVISPPETMTGRPGMGRATPQLHLRGCLTCERRNPARAYCYSVVLKDVLVRLVSRVNMLIASPKVCQEIPDKFRNSVGDRASLARTIRKYLVTPGRKRRIHTGRHCTGGWRSLFLAERKGTGGRGRYVGHLIKKRLSRTQCSTPLSCGRVAGWRCRTKDEG